MSNIHRRRPASVYPGGSVEHWITQLSYRRPTVSYRARVSGVLAGLGLMILATYLPTDETDLTVADIVMMVGLAAMILPFVMGLDTRDAPRRLKLPLVLLQWLRKDIAPKCKPQVEITPRRAAGSKQRWLLLGFVLVDGTRVRISVVQDVKTKAKKNTSHNVREQLSIQLQFSEPPAPEALALAQNRLLGELRCLPERPGDPDPTAPTRKIQLRRTTERVRMLDPAFKRGDATRGMFEARDILDSLMAVVVCLRQRPKRDESPPVATLSESPPIRSTRNAVTSPGAQLQG